MSAYDAPNDAARASAASAASARDASVDADWKASVHSGTQMPATTTPDVARNSRRVTVNLFAIALHSQLRILHSTARLLHEMRELGHDQFIHSEPYCLLRS